MTDSCTTICPACGRDYVPPRSGATPFPEDYRALRRSEAAATVESYHRHADQHRGWARYNVRVAEQADNLERECMRFEVRARQKSGNDDARTLHAVMASRAIIRSSPMLPPDDGLRPPRGHVRGETRARSPI